MNHTEMSRRALAIGFVWGFWLFWVIAGIACLTTHRIKRYPEPQYDSTGLAVAALIGLAVSFFPMVLDRWKHRRVEVTGPLRAYVPTLSGLLCAVRPRCLIEFAITLLVVIVAGGAAEGGEQDAIYLACFVVMVGLSYSCFRLRQVGLDYLEPLQGADEPDTEQRDDAKENETLDDP